MRGIMHRRAARRVALYAEAVRRCLGLDAPPKMALACIAAGRWVELPAGA